MQHELVTLIKEAIPTVSLIYLFGSYATQHERAESDIDIAVQADAPLDPLFRWQLANQLASTLGKEVDLIDLRQASTVLRMEIVRHGICLYQRGQEAAFFEMTALSMYQHLQQERAEILSDFKRSLLP